MTLGNIEIYAIPKKSLMNRKEEITPIKIDYKKTKGDKIVGTINVEEESNIEVAIPYDNGFTIKVDGKEIKYQESIQNGITFKIPKGKHKIEMIYEAPWKRLGAILSLLGILGITIRKKV